MCMKTWNLPGMYEQLKKASVLTTMMLVREFQKGGKIALQLDTLEPSLPSASPSRKAGTQRRCA